MPIDVINLDTGMDIEIMPINTKHGQVLTNGLTWK